MPEIAAGFTCACSYTHTSGTQQLFFTTKYTYCKEAENNEYGAGMQSCLVNFGGVLLAGSARGGPIALASTSPSLKRLSARKSESENGKNKKVKMGNALRLVVFS